MQEDGFSGHIQIPMSVDQLFVCVLMFVFAEREGQKSGIQLGFEFQLDP